MPSVVTIGNFDGVHRGHLALVRRCLDLAEPDGLDVVALTFDPPPVALIKPEALPPQLMPLGQRIRRLEKHGVDRVVVVTPTHDFLDRSPQAYVDSLVAEHDPRHVVTGPDFRFGKHRGGDVAMLAELGRGHGFEAHVVEELTIELSQGLAAPCRSTLIRRLVGQARLDDAQAAMLAPFSLTARVVRGDQRGRTIGFPTANLCPDDLAPFMLPPDGVYACTARLPDAPLDSAADDVKAAVSIGPKPTFHGEQLTVEAHLIDPPASLVPDPDALYGQTITLAFRRFIRDQQRFPTLDALTAQLARDVDLARDWLRSARPPAEPLAP